MRVGNLFNNNHFKFSPRLFTQHLAHTGKAICTQAYSLSIIVGRVWLWAVVWVEWPLSESKLSSLQVEDFLLHFWQGMPSHLHPILAADIATDLIAICDTTLYKAITNVYITTPLQSIPEKLVSQNSLPISLCVSPWTYTIMPEKPLKIPPYKSMIIDRAGLSIDSWSYCICICHSLTSWVLQTCIYSVWCWHHALLCLVWLKRCIVLPTT